MDEDEMVVSESEDSNDSWTTEEFSSEFIMRYGSRWAWLKLFCLKIICYFHKTFVYCLGPHKGIPDLAAMAHPAMKNHSPVLFRGVKRDTKM